MFIKKRWEIFKVNIIFFNLLINIFKGGFCFVFEVNLGRVVEDYSINCFKC